MSALELVLRFDIPCGFQVLKWAPTSRTEAAVFQMTNDCTAAVWIPPDTGFRWGQAFQSTSNATCQRIRIQMEFTRLACTIGDAFAQYDAGPPPSGDFEDFLWSVYRDVRRIANRFFAYVRGELGQWGAVVYDDWGPFDFFQKAEAHWSLDGESWTRLRGPGPVGVPGAVLWGDAWVEREDWDRIASFLESGADVDTTKQLAAEARQLAHYRELRNAVLETAICIERELSLMVDRFLESKGIPSKRVRGKDGSTTTLLTVWLPLIRPATEQEHMDASQRILRLRNNILHNAQTSVPDDAREAVFKATALATELCDERLQAPTEE